MDFADGQHFTIAIDQDGNALVDGNALLPSELPSQLRTMIDESSSHLSVVTQVDGECKFEHVSRILSLCEEAGIENVPLESLGRLMCSFVVDLTASLIRFA